MSQAILLPETMPRIQGYSERPVDHQSFHSWRYSLIVKGYQRWGKTEQPFQNLRNIDDINLSEENQSEPIKLVVSETRSIIEKSRTSVAPEHFQNLSTRSDRECVKKERNN